MVKVTLSLDCLLYLSSHYEVSGRRWMDGSTAQFAEKHFLFTNDNESYVNNFNSASRAVSCQYSIATGGDGGMADGQEPYEYIQYLCFTCSLNPDLTGAVDNGVII